MSGWIILIFSLAAVSAATLLAYILRARKEGDRVLVAHGLILLLGLVLASIGVAALKLASL
jgi:hypothetical protein